MPWTAADIPDQSGRVVVVTGGNGGLGEVTARELARKGAHVIIAARNLEKAAAAEARIREAVSEPSIEVRPLDLSDLSSVRAFASGFDIDHLDLLINNAGVMAIPYRQTADGFEMQIGTNHLGHFALTGLLLGKLLAAPAARVVSVASNAHRMRQMDMTDLRSDAGYSNWDAYARSKVANLLFTYELQRRLARAQAPVIAVAGHPGYADTDLQFVAPRVAGSKFMGGIMSLGNKLLAQSADMGALPQLYAATHPDVVGGDYYGPGGLGEFRGYPKKVDSSKRSHDTDLQRQLWDQSVELTGVDFGMLAVGNGTPVSA
ncbi:MAG: SDR family NAD(P)-dependent oxidoreductase [Deltaproteobacteria bacterium]|nr:MAG: SDR family NAD(P)-dependent oxidoreductase [Deltaproteobacteria bacterium]